MCILLKIWLAIFVKKKLKCRSRLSKISKRFKFLISLKFMLKIFSGKIPRLVLCFLKHFHRHRINVQHNCSPFFSEKKKIESRESHRFSFLNLKIPVDEEIFSQTRSMKASEREKYLCSDLKTCSTNCL